MLNFFFWRNIKNRRFCVQRRPNLFSYFLSHSLSLSLALMSILRVSSALFLHSKFSSWHRFCDPAGMERTTHISKCKIIFLSFNSSVGFKFSLPISYRRMEPDRSDIFLYIHIWFHCNSVKDIKYKIQNACNICIVYMRAAFHLYNYFSHLSVLGYSQAMTGVPVQPLHAQFTFLIYFLSAIIFHNFHCCRRWMLFQH